MLAQRTVEPIEDLLAPPGARRARAGARESGSRAGALPTCSSPERSRQSSTTGSCPNRWSPGGWRRSSRGTPRCCSPHRCRSATLRRSSPARDRPPRVLANRGANGIDGTVSAAFGVAAAGGGPVVLLVGRCYARPRHRWPAGRRRPDLTLTIVLLNNDGGGIFHFLPVASHVDEIRASTSRPPPGSTFAHAAALYGCGYRAGGRRPRPRIGGLGVTRERSDDDHRGPHRAGRQPTAARRHRGRRAGCALDAAAAP